MEIISQREARVHEQEWAAQELREALKNAGWLLPHSFKLRNPNKQGRYKQVKAFHFRVGQPDLPARMEQALSTQERLRFYRECGYHMNYDDPIPGDDVRSSWAMLQTQLTGAVRLGYTELESVGKTFFDIGGFLLERAVRPFEPRLSNQERRDLLLAYHRVLYPYPGVAPLMPESMPPLWVPEEGGWVMECQGSGLALKLVHFVKSSQGLEIVCEIQWNDDPYLVNVAQEYLLLLLFRAQLPPDQQLLLADSRADLRRQLATWGPERLPSFGTRYRCPDWMERILNRGYY